MSDSKFPIFGADIPPMLGRERILRRLWSNVRKETPSHLSVVGPRYAGKSVLLKAFEQSARSMDLPNFAVILWDLGHQPPRSDEEFMKLLCRRLGEGIKNVNKDYSKHLLSVESDEYVEICEVMDALHDDGQKILMLWDGFDKPLSSGTLTRNLWDNLLELCKKRSFRLLTSTRKELHLLIREVKSMSSDFWGIFEGIIRVNTFDDDDMEMILLKLPDLVFQSGAKTELKNFSAGIPPLFLEILNQILIETQCGQIDNQKVKRAANSAMEKTKIAGAITSMWEDCTAEAKDLYIYLCDNDTLQFDDAGKYERNSLIEKGFAQHSGNKLIAMCRMLQEHIKGMKTDTGSIARMFGTWDNYKSNIRILLQRRMSHISSFDERLCHLVERAIEDIPEFPDDCLNNLTGIRDCALKLVWQRECGDGMSMPAEIISYWTTTPRDGDKLVRSMMLSNCWTVPTDPLDQIRLLGLLTGSKRNFAIKAKTTSKDTYVLLDSIHNFRNRIQHSDGQSIHLGVAVAAIVACLELLSCLERESK